MVERQIQPTLTGPDIADIAHPFLIGPFCREVTVHQVRRDVERVIAVSGRFEFPRSFNDDPVVAHQSPDPAVPDIDTDFL